MTPLAIKTSYASSRLPRYGVLGAPKQKTYTTLAQPAMQPLNPLYRAMAASSGGDGQGAMTSSPARITSPLIDLGGQLISAPRVSPPGSPATPLETPPPTAPDGGSGTGAGMKGGSTFDFTSDPILAQIKALGDKSVGDAETGALGLKKQAFVRSGFGDLAQTLLGDTGTAEAAKSNPESTLAQLMLAHRQRQQGIDQTANARNTFYGSAHANQLGDEARQFELDQSNAQNALYDLLSQADAGVLAAKQHASDQYQAELPGAYQRAKEQVGAGGTGDGGTGGGGGGTDNGGDGGDGGANTALGLLTAPDFLTALALAAAKRRQAVAI